jgi:DNA-binding transcriptional ArsR family regulator
MCYRLVPHPLQHSAAARPPTGREPSEIAEAMSALAAESRVRLLYALLERERTVEELAGVVEMERSAVSQQLRILRQLRFVVAERDGRWVRYRLHDEHVAELLAAVRHHHEHASSPMRTAARGTRHPRSKPAGIRRQHLRA